MLIHYSLSKSTTVVAALLKDNIDEYMVVYIIGISMGKFSELVQKEIAERQSEPEVFSELRKVKEALRDARKAGIGLPKVRGFLRESGVRVSLERLKEFCVLELGEKKHLRQTKKRKGRK